MIEVEKNNIQIKQITISKEFQDLGISTILLNKLKEYAKSKKIKKFIYIIQINKKSQ